MNITLGVYDVFTYTTPGSLYLALLVYIADLLGWIDPLRVLQWNTTLILIGAGILSYLLGHITYGLGYLLSRIYGHDKNMDDARREFIERVPAAAGRSFKSQPLCSASSREVYGMGAAAEIGRLRAVGLMLRNSAPVFVLGAIVEIGDTATGSHPTVAGCTVVILLLAALGCLSQSVILSHWANMKTLELAYWIPDIDARLNRRRSATQSQHSSTMPAKQPVRSTTSTPRRSRKADMQQSGPPQ